MPCSGDPTPAKWSSSSWPYVPISSSTSSTPSRLTWRRKACCRRWRRPRLRATCTSTSPHEGDQRGGQRQGWLCAGPGAPGNPAVRSVSENTSEKGKKISTALAHSIHFIWIRESCTFVFIQSEILTAEFSGCVSELLYCTHFLHNHIVPIHTVEQNIIQLYISTCTQISSIYLLMCVDILLLLVLMHCYSSCTLPRFKF